MQYVKTTNGNADQYPYTVGKLRRDNPNTSFPKKISESLLASYGVYPVTKGPIPNCGVHQYTQRNDLPTLKNGVWVLDYTVYDMFADTTDEDGVTTTKAEHEAAHQARLNTYAAERNRTQRDLLIGETDWWASSDLTMTAEQTAYRQALRDITSHANWPHLDEADWPTKP
jgi:hypothetical protein